MQICKISHKIWEVIESETTEGEKNDMATALLFQSIPEALILQVGDLNTAKKVWDAIKARHMGAERVREARLQTLAEFDRLKMKNSETIDDFAGKLSEISSKSAALGVEIEEPKLVRKFLKSLPRKKYIQIVAALEQLLDLNKTNFEDIIGHLKAYEERVAEEEETEDDHGKLMYANSEAQNGQSNHSPYNGDNYRGRGRGGRFYREEDEEDTVERDTIPKQMHCPELKLKLQEAHETDNTETQTAEELMMHEVVFLNEKNVLPEKYETNTGEGNIWYLDNGANNHMTGDRRYFSWIDDTITGKVRFGDDSRIDIKGKGNISFTDMHGESREMTDIYCTPDLKSNIISLGQATEAGCDIRLRGEQLTMHDQKGKLLVTASRSKNRLYKVHMGIKSQS
ncbi:uncharacterized protein LOC103873793 [Brassica rapa]|uniref:uncharacterized protein LOC103873793 n=1 Tax=Brassica campestris TaxID=3711 RepID=UPI0004F1837C|nr:uncharacterized protein LOC103873793 [Brassica rapa]